MIACGVVLGMLALAALVAAGGPVRRWTGFAIALASVPVPLATDQVPFLGFLAAVLSIAAIGRVRDLAALEPGGWGAFRRVVHVLAPFDTRRARAAPPALDRAALARAAGFACLAAAALVTAAWLAPRLPSHAARLAGRWLAGAVATYSVVDAVVATVLIGCGLAGALPPSLHRNPIAARTVAEFWGERWNRPVGEWLHTFCFRPLARRGHPVLGIALAFAASGLAHFYITFVALDVFQGLLMASFFVLQFPIVVAERAIRVPRWRPALARAWTIAAILAFSPLFLEPMLRVLGVAPTA